MRTAATRFRRGVVASGAVAAAALLAACGRGSPSAVSPQAPQSHVIARVWWLMFGLAIAVYLVVGGFIIVALLRRPRDDEAGAARRENRFIWLGGIIVPALILGFLGVVTVRATADIRGTKGRPVQIEVVGRRWWWEVRYPSDGIVSADEVHVPVGRPVNIRLRSDDVIHSFWVPQLMGKVDMLPDHANNIHFTAQRAGTYLGECAEFCGLQHARMRFMVVAQAPADFDVWTLRHRGPAHAPATEEEARGQMVLVRSACAGCHTVRGTEAIGRAGPDLSDVGSRATIGAGTVPNDTGNLAGWVVNSQSIKPGNLMPPVSLEPGELQALVAYLQSLK